MAVFSQNEVEPKDNDEERDTPSLDPERELETGPSLKEAETLAWWEIGSSPLWLNVEESDRPTFPRLKERADDKYHCDSSSYPGTSVPDRETEYPISKIEPLKEPEAKSECLSSLSQLDGLV